MLYLAKAGGCDALYCWRGQGGNPFWANVATECRWMVLCKQDAALISRLFRFNHSLVERCCPVFCIRVRRSASLDLCEVCRVRIQVSLEYCHASLVAHRLKRNFVLYRSEQIARSFTRKDSNSLGSSLGLGDGNCTKELSRTLEVSWCTQSPYI